MPSAVSTLAALPFGNLIGGPLRAAVTAQGEAAKATVAFIRAVGFDSTEVKAVDGSTHIEYGKVRNVIFKYTKKDSTGADKETSIEVPILTIVPIPFIRIEEMTIDFTAKVTETIDSSSTSKDDTAAAVSAGASGGFWGVNVEFKASYSSTHSSTEQKSSRYNVECTINVHVRAVQDSLPAGLSRILAIMEASIKEPLPAPVK